MISKSFAQQYSKKVTMLSQHYGKKKKKTAIELQLQKTLDNLSGKKKYMT